ncbi:MAG: 2Fe-2S iron-sulfur cluster binding domain-containing protein [Flavobacteriaceae bacterium]|nr:2Fe-2S iron-sulfur cluster binding domain-containing protein [Flavobacteriaceae bacterium]
MAYTAYHFATIQHPDGVKWDELPFESTHLIKGREKNLFVRSLLGQGYHAMHHFMPHVPWYKYHRVWYLGNNIFSKQPIPERPVFGKLDKNARKKFLKAKEKELSRLNVKIARIEEVAMNIKTYFLEPTEGKVLPKFSAGSHIDLELPSGIKRSYSLVNPPFEQHQYQIAVKKEENGKGGSKELHEKVGIGDILKISIPKNNFVLYEKPKRFILIAGGIGITPLISMAHRLEELDKHFEFHICAKDEKEIPFTYELKNWSFAPMVELHLDKNGKPTIDLSAILSKPDSETLIYVCGPKVFNDWILSSAVDMGWEKNQLKQELFTADASAFDPPREFQVILRKSNKTINVPKNLSIIDAIEMQGISIDYSCLQGTCGTCVSQVIEGKIDHRDAVLSEEEKLMNQKICLCVSRAKGDKLILDL